MISAPGYSPISTDQPYRPALVHEDVGSNQAVSMSQQQNGDSISQSKKNVNESSQAV